LTEVGLKYSNGPLNIAVASLKSGSTTNQVTATVVPANTASSTHSSIGANYAIGALTVYAGYNKGDTIGAAAVTTAGLFPLQAINANLDTKGSRFGLKYVTGAVTLIGSYAEQDISFASGTVTRKITGARAEYALSKRTSLFAAYENFDTGVASTSASATQEGGKITTTVAGVRHSF